MGESRFGTTTVASAHIGKYRLIAELGHGGMAEVFLAVVGGPAGFNKLVVLKQIRPQLAEDPEFLGMFLDEARLAARLSHPNVVQTNEVGEGGGRYFIAMEYLEGQPLNRVIHRIGRAGGLPLDMHLRIVVDVLAGLQYAHELTDYDGTPLGVVHRDVTPHNVFVTYEGQVKVVDFGIAKALNSSAETRTGVLKGKVAYMAPEQARGERVDRRADIFSIGTLLWEAAAGKRLWKGVPDITILQRLLSADVPSPRSVRPEVPPALEAIVLRALAHDKEHRYATAAELQGDLEAFLEHMGSRATSRDVGRVIAQHFEADRAKIRGLIETQLRQPEATQLPVFDPPTVTASSSNLERVSLAPGSVSASSASVGGSMHPGSSYTSSSGLSASTRGPDGGRRGLVVGLALAVGALLAVAVWMMARGASRTETAVAASGQPTSASPAPAAPPPAATEVDVRVAAKPADAKIFVDDALVEGNPYKGKLPKDAKPHVIRVEAEGYSPTTRTVTPQKDLDLDLALEKDAVPVAAKPAAPSRRSAAAPPPKEDDMTRPAPKPKRTLDTSNPYAK